MERIYFYSDISNDRTDSSHQLNRKLFYLRKINEQNLSTFGSSYYRPQKNCSSLHCETNPGCLRSRTQYIKRTGRHEQKDNYTVKELRTKEFVLFNY